MRDLIFGVGINDGGKVITRTVRGRGARCEYYERWHSMMRRCYSDEYQQKGSSYEGWEVVPEWHRFTVFKSWMQSQDWAGKALDKDLLHDGSKTYGPRTCLFIPVEVNSLATVRGDVVEEMSDRELHHYWAFKLGRLKGMVQSQPEVVKNAVMSWVSQKEQLHVKYYLYPEEDSTKELSIPDGLNVITANHSKFSQVLAEAVRHHTPGAAVNKQTIKSYKACSNDIAQAVINTLAHNQLLKKSNQSWQWLDS